MIHFCAVSKWTSDEKREAAFVLRDATVSLPTNGRVALFGEDQQSLTTILHLLAGSEVPDRGRIVVGGLRRSPIINAGGTAGSSLVRRLSGVDNVNFFARIHGVDPGHLLGIVGAACHLGELWRLPVSEYDVSIRRGLEIALIAALPYDCYFLDKIDRLEHRLIWQLFHAVRLRGAGIFFTTRKIPLAARFGEARALVAHGSIRVSSDLKEAIAGHERARR